MLSTRISWRTCLRIFKTSCNFLQTIFGLRNIIICIRFRPHAKASVSTTTRGAGRLLSQYLLKWQLRINHHAHNALSILFQQRRYFIHRCSRVWSVSYSQSTCFFIWNDWITWIPYNGYGLVSRIVLVLRVNPFFYQQYLLWVRSTLMFMCQRLMFLFEVGVTTQLYFHLNRNNVVPKVARLVLFMQNGLNIEWDFS